MIQGELSLDLGSFCIQKGFIYSPKGNAGFHFTDYFCILSLKDISKIRYSVVEQFWPLLAQMAKESSEMLLRGSSICTADFWATAWGKDILSGIKSDAETDCLLKWCMMDDATC